MDYSKRVCKQGSHRGIQRGSIIGKKRTGRPGWGGLLSFTYQKVS